MNIIVGYTGNDLHTERDPVMFVPNSRPKVINMYGKTLDLILSIKGNNLNILDKPKKGSNYKKYLKAQKTP